MTDKKVNKKHVEAFFLKTKSYAMLKLGLVLGVIGVVSVYGAGENESVAFGVILLLVALSLIIGNIVMQAPEVKYYKDVVNAKRIYFGKVLARSFDKTNTQADALFDFDTPDVMDIDPSTGAEEEESVDDVISRKSLFIAGVGEKPDHVKCVDVNDRQVVMFTPVRTSILYLTKNEMIVYIASVDIITGDLKTEAVNRFFLKEIVGVSSSTETTRISRQGNESFFRSFKKVSGDGPGEIVRRESQVVVTTTDGRGLQLPIGMPQYSSGDKGTLDLDKSDDHRFDRVVRELSDRINTAKQAGQAGSGYE